MSIELNFPFTTAGNYTYGSLVEVTGGKAQLVKGSLLPDSTAVATYGTDINLDLGLGTLTETAAGSDAIKYILKKGTSWYYYTGSAWAVSDGTYSQSNTAAEIEAAKATFTTSVVVSKVKAFLHSDDGSTTPQLDAIDIHYDFSGETGDTISTCIVWCYDKTLICGASACTIDVELNKKVEKYKTNTTVASTKQTVTPDTTTGYWEIELIENANMMSSDAKYIFTINGKKYEKTVPNETTKCFWDLV